MNSFRLSNTVARQNTDLHLNQASMVHPLVCIRAKTDLMLRLLRLPSTLPIREGCVCQSFAARSARHLRPSVIEYLHLLWKIPSKAVQNIQTKPLLRSDGILARHTSSFDRVVPKTCSRALGCTLRDEIGPLMFSQKCPKSGSYDLRPPA